MNFIARKLLWQASMGQVKDEGGDGDRDGAGDGDHVEGRNGIVLTTKDDSDGGRVHTVTAKSCVRR